MSQNPLEQYIVADWIVEFLDKQGIEFVFSHPGGPVLPLYESMRKAGSPKNILVRHEGAGSFMADAYSKVAGKVGVCMSTMGPGAANMTIGVGTAMSDSSPLLAITGQLPVAVHGRGYQQETDHNALFRGITKATVQLKQAKSAPEVFERAYRIAISGRMGPVHVDAPVDVSGSSLDKARPPAPVSARRLGTPDKADVVEAWNLIRKSSSPVLLAGGGVILGEASEKLQAFAEMLEIPVATSFNGRGSIPEDHPLSLGRLGEYTPSYCRKIASSADLLIAVGYRFTDVSMEGWKASPEAKIIQIDIEPSEIGKTTNVDAGLVGDAGNTLSALLREAKKSSGASRKTWIENVKRSRSEWKREYSKVESSGAVPLKPQRVIRDLATAIGRDAIVCSGAGRAKMWAASVLPVYGARNWITSGGYAVMGYELPAAIACKLAKPERTVVSVGGDASFQMHCQEIATALEHHAPFVGLVLNDMALGSIKNAQLKKYGRLFGTEFEYDVDLSRVSKAFGGLGSRVLDPSEIAPAIEDAIKSDKPYVIDAKVDGSEVPTFDN